MQYKRHQKISMKSNPELSEKWIQKLLTEDPSLLGFGDINVKDVERRQAQGGRLDMLLFDGETSTRYEVELQLGATDESHIIRTIEYWDFERRRFPQYDHVAVIVAEEITARFFNVISLFNGFIPIVAIQVTAIQISDEEVTLVFTRVLDRATLGLEEDEVGEPTDRAYWEHKSSPKMLALVDGLLVSIREFDPTVELKYNKYYIGLARNGVATLYAAFTPQRHKVNLEIKIPRSDETTELLDSVGIDSLTYDTNWSRYRPNVRESTTDEQLEILMGLVRQAHDLYHE